MDCARLMRGTKFHAESVAGTRDGGGEGVRRIERLEKSDDTAPGLRRPGPQEIGRIHHRQQVGRPAIESRDR
jgi:hypothetical protein